MLKQTIVFRNKATLSLHNNQLVIKQDDREITRPIEDIGIIFIENQQVHLTIPLINELAACNVAIAFCNQHSMPSSLLLPLEGNSTMHDTMLMQIATSQPTTKQLWKQIVVSKIRNQSALLNAVGEDGNVLHPHYSNVKSGDTDNREGIAARIYWSRLMGNGFKREREGVPPNGLLNYGYAILRAATARAVVKSGLNAALGIHHSNRYNAFALVDDLMEPYRPWVDREVHSLFFNQDYTFLDPEVKKTLQGILTADVMMDGMLRPLEVALSMTTGSFVRVLKGETKNYHYLN